jgi:hypothetical protein
MSEAAETSERMAERSGVSRTAFWLYVAAPRWLVALAVLAPVVLVSVGVGLFLPPASGDPVETLFQALVGATVTGVTLVVTLNQLVLSQELGAVGDQRERLTAATEFRRDVETEIDGVAPTDPAAFLRAILTAVTDRAETARAGATGGEAGPAVDTLAERLTTSARATQETLDGAEFGEFTVTRAALDFDYSRRIDETRRVRARRDLPPAVDETLAELVSVLELYGVAREHIKTLYFERALVSLSRSILAAAVPALAVGVGMVLSFRPDGGLGTALVLGGAVGVTLSPFAVLVAYVLRIATVTGRTLSIGPFTLRATDRDRIVEE